MNIVTQTQSDGEILNQEEKKNIEVDSGREYDNDIQEDFIDGKNEDVDVTQEENIENNSNNNDNEVARMRSGMVRVREHYRKKISPTRKKKKHVKITKWFHRLRQRDTLETTEGNERNDAVQIQIENDAMYARSLEITEKLNFNRRKL